MSISSAVWVDAQHSAIRVTLSDGRVLFVPADPANGDYQRLLADAVVIQEP